MYKLELLDMYIFQIRYAGRVEDLLRRVNCFCSSFRQQLRRFYSAKIMSDFKDSEEREEGKVAKNFSWMPAGCEPLADGEYDAIIMGTGLTECIISGLLSVNGKRVLHVDRNNYYGAETASLSLANLFQKFRTETPGANLGHSRGKLLLLHLIYSK